jgi:hypothetical protein
MPKNKYCSYCEEGTLKNHGAYRVCDYCSLVVWTGRDPVPPKSKLADAKCPNCQQKTLHHVLKVRTKQASFNLMRCATCDASAIEVPSGSSGEVRKQMSGKQE